MSSQDNDIRAFEIYIFRTQYFVFLVVNGRITTFFGKFWPKSTVFDDVMRRHCKAIFENMFS